MVICVWCARVCSAMCVRLGGHLMKEESTATVNWTGAPGGASVSLMPVTNVVDGLTGWCHKSLLFS